MTMTTRSETTSDVTSLLQELADLKEQTGNGIVVLMGAIDRRGSPGWQKAFARWTLLDQRYQQIVNENPGIEGDS